MTLGEEEETWRVLFPVAGGGFYDYLACEGGLSAGDYVEARLGGRVLTGVVWGRGDWEGDRGRLRRVERRLGVERLSERCREFLDWMTMYTLSAPGMALRLGMAAPRGAESVGETGAGERGAGETGASKSGVLGKPNVVGKRELSEEQEAAARALRESVGVGEFRVDVLDGITGSGKTEVYAEALSAAVEGGGQALALTPEIGLADEMGRRLEELLGMEVKVWHSGVRGRKRALIWSAALRGESGVFVGARSALFLPYAGLRCIVVDEEHEAGYKQEDGVLYQGRDMAVVRGRFEKASVVLSTATPSLETWSNVKRGVYGCVRLTKRHGGALEPRTRLVDLRESRPKEGSWLSPTAVEEIGGSLSRGEQALVLVNRRGFAPLALCCDCGERVMCSRCDVWMAMHKGGEYLLCHHCGLKRGGGACRECGGELTGLGAGVERVARELRGLFPLARLEVTSSDEPSGREGRRRLLEEMARGEVDVLVGTQLVSKGHHFPGLTTAVVVDGDMGLDLGDLRGGERVFQMLRQLSGRAGRAERAGTALIQTRAPDHPVMRALLSGDREGFMEREALMRERAWMAPHTRMAAFVLSGTDEEEVSASARDFRKSAPSGEGVKVWGPAPAPLSRLRGRYRVRLLLAVRRGLRVHELAGEWVAGATFRRGVRCVVDVDPYNFLLGGWAYWEGRVYGAAGFFVARWEERFVMAHRAAERYGRALYALAREGEDAGAGVEADARGFVECLEGSGELRGLLGSAAATREEKRRGLAAVLGRLGSGRLALGLATVMSRRGRGAMVGGAFEEFLRLKREGDGIVEVTIETAGELGEEGARRVKGAFAAALGCGDDKVVLKEVVDAGVLGGARVRVGMRAADGSFERLLGGMRSAASFGALRFLKEGGYGASEEVKR